MSGSLPAVRHIEHGPIWTDYRANVEGSELSIRDGIGGAFLARMEVMVRYFPARNGDGRRGCNRVPDFRHVAKGFGYDNAGMLGELRCFPVYLRDGMHAVTQEQTRRLGGGRVAHGVHSFAVGDAHG